MLKHQLNFFLSCAFLLAMMVKHRWEKRYTIETQNLKNHIKGIFGHMKRCFKELYYAHHSAATAKDDRLQYARHDCGMALIRFKWLIGTGSEANPDHWIELKEWNETTASWRWLKIRGGMCLRCLNKFMPKYSHTHMAYQLPLMP